MRNNGTVDKIFILVLVLCLIFWIIAKIPIIWDFILFGVIYQLIWALMMLLTGICTIYFIIKWFLNRFSLRKIYLYGFLLGVITLLIMRFVFSITFDGITWMPDYN